MTDSTNAKLRELRESLEARRKESIAKSKAPDISTNVAWYFVGKSDAAEDCVWLIDAMIQEAGE